MDTTRMKMKLTSKSVEDGDCWNWQGAMMPNGYGKVGWKLSDGSEVYLAHRASYLAFKGNIPDGMSVCHSCDNRRCVNPDHLWLGTNHDNVVDMVAKKRNHRKLSEEAVRSIKKLYAEGATQVALAAQFGVSQTLISNIVTGKSWATVT